MFTSIDAIKRNLQRDFEEKKSQGHDTANIESHFERLPDSYDKLYDIAERLRSLPMRDDWPYIEPSELDAIKAEADWPNDGLESDESAENLSNRARSAFLGSVAGCVLGKPLEVGTDLASLKTALETAKQWPLSEYVTEDVLDHLGQRHPSWGETVRERISYVAPDDDINYSIMGMLVLEAAGIEFTRSDLARMWVYNLAPRWTFGPERAFLAKAADDNTGWPEPEWDLSEEAIERWVTFGHFGVELCGAAIRADAYGYAALGDPGLAAEMAYRDASMTHRKTGIYGAMYNAAVIAAAPRASAPIDMFKKGLSVVPKKSRFFEIVQDCIDIVDDAPDWVSAYEHIHGRYEHHGFCHVLQEAGTMANSAKFADSTGHGISIQVSQGLDTDSYGATIGSILGAYFGPKGLEARWLQPFNDRIHTTLASFHETSLHAVADRMARLPALRPGRS